MGPGFRHPLDVDLADFADDLVDSAQREAIESHLDACLLCRIKLRRLREASHPQPEVPHPGQDLLTAAAKADAGHSAMAPIEPFGDVGVDQLGPGQVWAAGRGQRLLVLVLREHEERALVAPVTFDSEAADDEAFEVEAQISPFATSIVVYPALAAELPRSALVACFGQLFGADDLERLVAGDLPGTTRGEPITGPTDPRLEFRQMLADHLGMLDEPRPDPDTYADAPPPNPDRLASKLAAELRLRRGELCRLIRLYSWDDLFPAYARGWTPLARIDELGTILVVFDTPSGLGNDEDFDTAMGVVTRYSAAAVVVLATSLRSTADIYVPSSLSYGIEVPSGEIRPPAPVLAELIPADAVAKFLDQNSSRSEATWATRTSTIPSDVIATLSRSAIEAIAKVADQGRRAKIAPKIAAYTSVERFAEDINSVLRAALEGGEVAQRLSSLADRSER